MNRKILFLVVFACFAFTVTVFCEKELSDKFDNPVFYVEKNKNNTTPSDDFSGASLDAGIEADRVCLIAQLSAKIVLSMNASHSTEIRLNWRAFPGIPHNESIQSRGECASDNQRIQIAWDAAASSSTQSSSPLVASSANHSTPVRLDMHVWKLQSGTRFALKSLRISFASMCFETREDLSQRFLTPLNQTYFCQSAQNFSLSQIVSSSSSSLHHNHLGSSSSSWIEIDHFRLAAFLQQKSVEFTNSKFECSIDSDWLRNLVPIVVGFVLIGLILLSLSCYVIGRIRSRRLKHEHDPYQYEQI